MNLNKVPIELQYNIFSYLPSTIQLPYEVLIEISSQQIIQIVPGTFGYYPINDVLYRDLFSNDTRRIWWYLEDETRNEFNKNDLFILKHIKSN